MTYDETMAWGAAQYADILKALGPGSAFTQTGGMCAALEVQLETGHTLLITDGEDTLSWARAEHQGWWVGLYDNREDNDGPLAWGQADDSGVEALPALVTDVMFRRNGTNQSPTTAGL